MIARKRSGSPSWTRTCDQAVGFYAPVFQEHPLWWPRRQGSSRFPFAEDRILNEALRPTGKGAMASP